MKRLIVPLTFALALSANAQTTTDTATPSPTTAVAPAQPPAQSASDTTKPSPYVHMPQALQKMKADLAALQSQPCDIIFIGDSITAGWAHYGVTF